ncbi:MAG: TonB-dependent receptor plug domain-containing protein [Cytophagales bacterium]|nr:TonB-dependent receptor plug domain-containing protein [Cytophagales bacterium]
MKNGENRFLTLALDESTQSLEEIVVLGFGGGYRTEEASPTLKIPTPLLETPQQVVAIGQQVIADQQLFNLQEVARNVSGVSNSGQFTPALDINFSVRGFAANQYRNGLLIPAEDVSPDPVLVERVEFIKGPAFSWGKGPRAVRSTSSPRSRWMRPWPAPTSPTAVSIRFAAAWTWAVRWPATASSVTGSTPSGSRLGITCVTPPPTSTWWPPPFATA